MSNSCGAMRELSAVLISVFCIQYQATKPTPQEGEQPSCKEHNKWYIYIYINIIYIYIIIYIIPTYSNIRYCNIATMPPRKPHNTDVTGCLRCTPSAQRLHPASPRPMEIWKNRIVWIWNRESPVFPAANQHTITWQLSHLYLSLYPAVFSINLWRLPSSLHLFSNCLQNCANMCRYWLRNYLRKHGWELPGHSEGWSANPLILHHSTNYCDLFERRCSL